MNIFCSEYPSAYHAVRVAVKDMRTALPGAMLRHMRWYMWELAVVEVMTNIIRHGKQDETDLWNMCLDVHGSVLVATIVDGNDPYENPLPQEAMEPMAESGRGMALVHAGTSEFEYFYSGGKNIHVLKQNFA